MIAEISNEIPRQNPDKNIFVWQKCQQSASDTEDANGKHGWGYNKRPFAQRAEMMRDLENWLETL